MTYNSKKIEVKDHRESKDVRGISNRVSPHHSFTVTRLRSNELYLIMSDFVGTFSYRQFGYYIYSTLVFFVRQLDFHPSLFILLLGYPVYLSLSIYYLPDWYYY